jgi:hypothetical protein
MPIHTHQKLRTVIDLSARVDCARQRISTVRHPVHVCARGRAVRADALRGIGRRADIHSVRAHYVPINAQSARGPIRLFHARRFFAGRHAELVH